MVVLVAVIVVVSSPRAAAELALAGDVAAVSGDSVACDILTSCAAPCDNSLGGKVPVLVAVAAVVDVVVVVFSSCSLQA